MTGRGKGRLIVPAASVLSGLLAIVAAMGLLAIAAPGASAGSGDSSRAQLEQFVCQRAFDPAGRAISVQAVMRPVTGTKHMSLRFLLSVQTKPHGSFAAIRAGDLGRWLSPANPTLGQQPGDVWKLDKQVIDLAAPAVYRFRVTFRWTGDGGRGLGQVSESTPDCVQTELRPHLVVKSIAVHPVAGNSAQDRYDAVIANLGATAAGSFEVEFTDGGAVPQWRTIMQLKAHQSRPVHFVGPVCDPTSPPTVTADPNGQIDVATRAGSSRVAACPAAT